MNEITQMLVDSAARMFADGSTKAVLDDVELGVYPQALHDMVVENGFDRIGIAAEGFATTDVFELLKSAGRFAVGVPLAEMVLAARWVGESGDFVSIGVVEGARVAQVPWGRRADRVLALVDGAARIGHVCHVTTGTNIAGEPRDTVTLEAVEEIAVDEGPFEMLALSRVALMAGCLERVLDLGLTYAGEREQFGRPISKFQAIQHALAVVAAEVAAAKRAADAAIDALGGERFAQEVAAAKARVGEAVGIVAEAVHQVHGAMGFTHEHELHHFTRRLWAWRDEYGNEVFWQRRLGGHLAKLGADHVWDFVATQS
ncbi:MAG: acyl-CoA dehydrogenase family protein [Pseudomonadales bacterium]|nr:acyl-CoA dehydrogenase family protein [Pseudomonadales bacterium]MDP6470596.1 acyl-CoA dehydrogenase family protein [Pseudomonadales bacterium]MDP6828549.1 acyl-CoA dehydrogenase family protein [Pseudomonadales bacterium]MDP6972035.1 acyl-CoA dehydrogenase family protein [Pseudomonadales bacterium]